MPKSPEITHVRLIETDRFPFEFLSRVAERESWRKEVHRPIYHVHKWWAKRLGSVFRGILLGSMLQSDSDLATEFYSSHSFSDRVVLDPFMGSGTTIGEAHKLGYCAIGRDINPVAVNAVRVALGPLNRTELERAFRDLSRSVGPEIRALYEAIDSKGNPCEVLYYFWVMQAPCPCCRTTIDLFPSHVVARHAYPNRKRLVPVLCATCGEIFPCDSGELACSLCPSCGMRSDAREGTASGSRASCRACSSKFSILDALAGRRPEFRLYGKLVLNWRGEKEYLRATQHDEERYNNSRIELAERESRGEIDLPSLALDVGYNTRQAMNYGFLSWRDFFNDRQLLALGMLRRAIVDLPRADTRDALLTLFSGVLEFNNLFASYKGEGTGAVRHMFSHHILKPERTPIEANVWGTPKSSGSFTNLFRSRLLRAIKYRESPTEVDGQAGARGRVCSPPFSGRVDDWPTRGPFRPRGIYLSCGDSSRLGLPDKCVDLVVTDPPFFDNVHYSELADFFYAWQQIDPAIEPESTRSIDEVQDTNWRAFTRKLGFVLRECRRVLKDDGLLVFTYHHARDEGWKALIQALLQAGFVVVNSQPIKAEMSVATPKSQAREPIQLDIILTCRAASDARVSHPTVDEALESARAKLGRLEAILTLSHNDRKVVLYGQLLTTVRDAAGAESIAGSVGQELAHPWIPRPEKHTIETSKRETAQLALW